MNDDERCFRRNIRAIRGQTRIALVQERDSNRKHKFEETKARTEILRKRKRVRHSMQSDWMAMHLK